MSADSIEKIAYRKLLDERVLFEEHAPKMHADWFAWDPRTETYVEPICQAQWIGWYLARALPSAELERDAARYRWIRDGKLGIPTECAYLYDEAIDAARAKEAPR